MRSFLVQPYPFSDNIGRKLAVCGGIGVFISLFLIFFKPFGFEDLSLELQWKHALVFGAITFLISSFLQIVLPKIVPSLFKEENWRSWKEIVYLLITTLVVGGANYAAILYLYPQNSNLQGLLKAELITFQVGLFPILFVVFMKQMLLYRRYAEEAKEVSEDIKIHEEIFPPVHSLTAASKILLKGDNQKEELQVLPEELFYISSADNYVKIQYKENSGQRSVLIRSTLKKMEEQLISHQNFFRCHRMYIVNLQLVEQVSGNAQGLKLHLQDLEELIPVSRNLTDVVKEKLHQHSHSPQKA